jgi:hypothetical protein
MALLWANAGVAAKIVTQPARTAVRIMSVLLSFSVEVNAPGGSRLI